MIRGTRKIRCAKYDMIRAQQSRLPVPILSFEFVEHSVSPIVLTSNRILRATFFPSVVVSELRLTQPDNPQPHTPLPSPTPSQPPTQH